MSEVDDELAERARARVGQTLCGKYRIERVLGVGGMAFVYVATHRNGRRVAIKMLHPELSVRADLRKRFLLEGHAANAVNHPGAVAILDDDVAEDGAALLVMELLHGHSVEDLWRANGGVLAPKTVLAIVRELCDVLAAAHSVGVIHRDIKPANLFVTTDGHVKVLDFGLARVSDGISGANATATGLVFGTPAFLPPEQAAGRISQIDGRTDIWAVGATMFTLLSGKTVHEGESAQNLVMLAATKPPRSLAEILPDADPELVRIVDRALDFDRDARWPNARAMHEAVCALNETLLGDRAPKLAAMSDIIQLHPTAPTAGMSSPRDEEEWPVGMRTSQPVSSAAPTKAMARARLGQRVLAAVCAAAATIPMSTIAWRRRSVVASIGGLALAVGIVAIALRARSPSTPSTLPGSAAAALPDSDYVDLPLAPATPATAETVTSSDMTPRTTSSAPAVASARAANAIRPGRRAPVRQPATALSTKSVQDKATSAAEQPNEKPSEKSRPDCSSNFYVDGTGKKIWKPECLQRGAE